MPVDAGYHGDQRSFAGLKRCFLHFSLLRFRLAIGSIEPSLEKLVGKLGNQSIVYVHNARLDVGHPMAIIRRDSRPIASAEFTRKTVTWFMRSQGSHHAVSIGPACTVCQ